MRENVTESPKSIKKLRALSSKNPLAIEVEHLLALVFDCRAQHLPEVEALLLHREWMTCEEVEAELGRSGRRYVPLASWRRLVLGCIANGAGWTAGEAISGGLDAPLAVSVLAATGHPGSAEMLIRVAQICAQDDRRDGHVLRRCVEELNLWGLPPKGKGAVSPVASLDNGIRKLGREQLEDLACNSSDEHIRTNATYALRWFGNSSTIPKLAGAPELPEPFTKAKAEVMRFLQRSPRS